MIRKYTTYTTVKLPFKLSVADFLRNPPQKLVGSRKQEKKIVKIRASRVVVVVVVVFVVIVVVVVSYGTISSPVGRAAAPRLCLQGSGVDLLSTRPDWGV